MASDTDRHFVRFRETGEPEALAAVFDATAPGLLLLAIHLTRDEVGAEDLVQHTFLKVIEHADSYDPQQPFLPWASTLLANEARQQWRQRHRRARAAGGDGRAAPAVETLAAAVSADPQRVVAEAETLQAVVGAIDGLEPAFRSVVRLKVVHGMKPGAIAEVLELSPEVARTRLSRGLQQLRARLPAGVAGALVITLGGRGMAQVRAAVLAQSGAVRGVGSAVRVRRSMVGRVIGLVGAAPAVALVLLVASVALLVGLSGVGGERPVAPERSAAETGGAAAGTPAGRAAATGPRREIESPTVAEEGASRPEWILRGVVSSANGGPLAGAAVGVAWVQGCDVRGLPVVVTDAEGRYRVALDGLRELGELGLLEPALQIDVTAPGHHPDSTVLLDALPRFPVAAWSATHDLSLTPGPVLRARLLESSGAPARGWSQGRVLSADPAVATSWLETDTRARGPDDPLDPALLMLPVVGAPPYRLEVIGADGFAFVAIEQLPADGDIGEVRLDPLGEVVGRLVSPAGVPVPFAGVRLVQVGGDRSAALGADLEQPRWRDGRIEPVRAAAARTDARGVFRARGLAEGTYRLSLDHGDVGPVLDTLATGERLRDVQVAGQVLRVRAVDAEGRAIPGMSLRYDWLLDGVRHTGRNEINDEPGRFDFLVPFGSTWRFDSGHHRVAATPLVHTASPREPEAELLMVVRANSQQGQLALAVRFADGTEVADYTVDPYHLDYDHLADSIHSRDLQGGSLPAGHYSLRISAAGSVPDPATAFVPELLELEIRAGEVSTAVVAVQRAGVVDVDLTGYRAGNTEGLWLQQRIEGAWHLAGALPPAPRAGVPAQAQGASWRLRSSMPFPAGLHTLRVVGPTGASDVVELLVVPGRVTSLRAILPPR